MVPCRSTTGMISVVDNLSNSCSINQSTCQPLYAVLHEGCMKIKKAHSKSCASQNFIQQKPLLSEMFIISNELLKEVGLTAPRKKNPSVQIFVWLTYWNFHFPQHAVQWSVNRKGDKSSSLPLHNLWLFEPVGHLRTPDVVWHTFLDTHRHFPPPFPGSLCAISTDLFFHFSNGLPREGCLIIHDATRIQHLVDIIIDTHTHTHKHSQIHKKGTKQIPRFTADNASTAH